MLEAYDMGGDGMTVAFMRSSSIGPAAFLLVAGCAPALATRIPEVRVAPARLAAGPASISIFEFGGDGSLTPRPDWTGDAAKNVDAAVAARVTLNGGRTFVPEDVAHTDVPYGDFRHWTSAALQEIAGALAGTRASAHRSVAEWRYPQSLSTWRAALGADFVLAVLFADAYEPAGQGAAAAPPASAAYRAAQTGIACAVSLGDGRIVWCETARAGFGDLRAAEAARAAVGAIVTEVCPQTVPAN
jgi:hypothetical protein